MAVTTDSAVPDDVVARSRSPTASSAAARSRSRRHADLAPAERPAGRAPTRRPRQLPRLARGRPDRARGREQLVPRRSQPRSVVRAENAERRVSPLSDSTRPRHARVGPARAREVGEHAAVRRRRSRPRAPAARVAQRAEGLARRAATRAGARLARGQRAPASGAPRSTVTRRSIASDSRAGTSQRAGGVLDRPGRRATRATRGGAGSGRSRATQPSSPGTASITIPSSAARRTPDPLRGTRPEAILWLLH